MFRVLPSPLALFVAIGLLTGASLAGCVASSVRGEREATPREGLDGYRLVTAEARSLAGCRYGYRVYEPARPAATVVLGHGFLRDQDTLVDLSRALANAGHRAVTLDFCNMRPWNGHHARNAADMLALATRVTDGAEANAAGVIYAGFSAGALAALIAAASDTAALGVVTLDLVDQGGLAGTALAALEAPLLGLQGPPSACNANGSGQRVFDTRPNAPLETLPGASHCEFESPTNALCELACGDDDADADDERVRADVIRRVVDAVDRLVDGKVPDVGAPALSASRPRVGPARTGTLRPERAGTTRL